MEEVHEDDHVVVVDEVDLVLASYWIIGAYQPNQIVGNQEYELMEGKLVVVGMVQDVVGVDVDQRGNVLELGHVMVVVALELEH